MENKSTKPAEVYRYRGVSASVFRNVSKAKDREVPYFKVSLQKTYRDDEGNFKTTPSLGRDDLPVAAELLRKAWLFILDAEASSQSEE